MNQPAAFIVNMINEAGVKNGDRYTATMYLCTDDESKFWTLSRFARRSTGQNTNAI